MTLERTQRLRRTDAPPESLGIGPEEYFVLSRVDGQPSVGDILGQLGLPADKAEKIVQRLVELGALEVIDAAPAAATNRDRATTNRGKPLQLGGSGMRQRADSRRRLLLQQQLGNGTPRPKSSTPPPDEPASEAASDPAPELETPTGPPVPPVPPDDPRLDPALPIKLELQRQLLALHDRFDDLTPFELLGLYPTDDEKAIKKGYFEASRRLHPDAYYGKDLGPFRIRLDRLFARAKQAYAELRKPEVRRPYIAVMEARHAEVEAQRRAAQQRVEREQETAREAERAEQRRRRIERDRERVRARDERLRSKLSDQAAEYLAEVDAAMESNNLARASNFLRLALQAEPNNDEIRARWEATRALARKERAKVAFSRALAYLEYGQMAEARPLFVEAADADPTAEYLAFAADVVKDTDAAAGRDFAMKALERLNAAMGGQKPEFDVAKATRLRLMIARAFQAAGQTRTATELALVAKGARPDDPEVRALLKSLKVT